VGLALGVGLEGRAAAPAEGVLEQEVQHAHVGGLVADHPATVDRGEVVADALGGQVLDEEAVGRLGAREDPSVGALALVPGAGLGDAVELDARHAQLSKTVTWVETRSLVTSAGQ